MMELAQTCYELRTSANYTRANSQGVMMVQVGIGIAFRLKTVKRRFPGGPGGSPCSKARRRSGGDSFTWCFTNTLPAYGTNDEKS